MEDLDQIAVQIMDEDHSVAKMEQQIPIVRFIFKICRQFLLIFFFKVVKMVEKDPIVVQTAKTHQTVCQANSICQLINIYLQNKTIYHQTSSHLIRSFNLIFIFYYLLHFVIFFNKNKFFFWKYVVGFIFAFDILLSNQVVPFLIKNYFFVNNQVAPFMNK